MLPAVREFLDRVPPRLHRPLLDSDPEVAVRARACGGEWRAYLESMGMPVPEALIELADARADVFVWIACEHHSWELFAPDDASETGGSLAKLAVQFPELAERAQMAPLLGQDGDLLLLANDGRIHSFTHDDWEHDGVVAPDFEALLVALTRSSVRGSPTAV